jgi:hypothetical protein
MSSISLVHEFFYRVKTGGPLPSTKGSPYGERTFTRRVLRFLSLMAFYVGIISKGRSATTYGKARNAYSIVA